MPGPPRKPRKIIAIEGNRGHRKKTYLQAPEPEPTRGIPTPPEWFDPIALEIWNRLTPELDRLGLITVVDGPALEGACVAYSRAVACGKVLERDGLVAEVGDQGYRQQRPEVSIEQKSWAQYRAFCTEFGLTAAARSRLSVAPEKGRKLSPLDEAIFGS